LRFFGAARYNTPNSAEPLVTIPVLDAYRVLQVDPTAHQVVIRAAYLALARQYHPDGDTPDQARMAELSRAYDLVRNESVRRLYDARRALLSPHGPSSLSPVGPGQPAAGGAPTAGTTNGDARGTFAGAAPPPEAESPHAGPFARARTQTATDSARLDFGRYQGWSLRDLARHDPDYLRWLSRHSSGIRYRAEIQRLLPDEAPVTGGHAQGRG
jgi:curved DNA-binding protein CbpA